MKFPGLTRLPENKRFKFSPRYYDAVKEEIEDKISLAERQYQNRGADEYVKNRISGSFQRNSKQDRKSFVLQVFIAGLLCLLFYFILV